MHFLRLFWSAAKRWIESDASRLAAALAYFTPFALVPLVVISISIVGWFTDRAIFAALLQDWGAMLGLGATEILADAVGEYDVEEAYFGVPILAIIFLVAMIVFTVNNLADGLRVVWGVHRRVGVRTVVSRVVRALSFFILLQIFFITLFFIEVSLPDLVAVSVVPLQRLLLFIAIVTLFTVGYKILSWKSPTVPACLAGGIVVALALLFMRTVVGWWLYFTPAVEQYGAAGLIFALLVWIYVTAMVIYYGAAYAWAFDHQRLDGPARRQTVARP